MFMFIIYALIIYIASVGASIYIKKDSKVYSIRGVIGFATLVGLLQVIYYPFQYIQASSTIMNSITLIIVFIAFVIGCIRLRKEDTNFFKTYEFWIILFLVFILAKIIPGNEAGDDYFYMNLFKDNSNINKINSIDPRTGMVGKIDSVYLYQGYYTFMSFFYKIQNTLFPNNIDNIFISFRTTMSLITVIFSSQVLNYIKKIYIKNKVFYIIQVLSILLVSTLEWTHIYWGSFMLFQIFIPLCMILFDLYLKDRKYKYILFFVNLGTLALASSMLFLFLILSFSYFFYEVTQKKVNVFDYFLILIPSMIYISFVFNKLYLLVIILLMIIIISKFSKIFNSIINKYFKYLLYVLPAIFVIFSFFGNYVFKLESYRVSKVTIAYNLVISIYIIIVLIKNKQINPNLFVFMVVVIYFFNPLVQPFVSHHFTSTYVYYRLFYITKNPLIVTVIFTSIYDYIINCKYSTILKPIYFSLVALITLYYGYHLISNTVMSKNYNISYNYILREDEYSRNLGKQLQKVDSGSKIFSVYFAPRIYNENLITKVARYPDDYDMWYKDIMVITLYRVNNISKREYGWFCAEVEKEKYDYLITYNTGAVNKFIDSRFKTVYKNDLFILLKTN